MRVQAPLNRFRDQHERGSWRFRELAHLKRNSQAKQSISKESVLLLPPLPASRSNLIPDEESSRATRSPSYNKPRHAMRPRNHSSPCRRSRGRWSHMAGCGAARSFYREFHEGHLGQRHDLGILPAAPVAVGAFQVCLAKCERQLESAWSSCSVQNTPNEGGRYVTPTARRQTSECSGTCDRVDRVPTAA